MFGKARFLGFALVAGVMLSALPAIAQETVEAAREARLKRYATCYAGVGDSDMQYFRTLITQHGPIGSKRKSKECAIKGTLLRVEGGEDCEAVMRNFVEKFGKCIPEDLLRSADPKKYTAVKP